MSKAEFLAERHIEVVSRWTAHRVIELEMQRAGVQRNIVLRVPSFVGLAQIVENTDLLAMVPVHLGSILAKNGNLQVISAPFKVPTYSIKQYWHERYNQDAANRWFRELMVELFAEPRASER
jgi:DNA-binding transcriptional LysR family regulator